MSFWIPDDDYARRELRSIDLHLGGGWSEAAATAVPLTQEDRHAANAWLMLRIAQDELDGPRARGRPRLGSPTFYIAACLVWLEIEPSSGEVPPRLQVVQKAAAATLRLAAGIAARACEQRDPFGFGDERLTIAELHLRLAADGWERWCCPGGAVGARRRIADKVFGSLLQAAAAAWLWGASMPALQVLTVLRARVSLRYYFILIDDDAIADLALRHADKLTVLHCGFDAAAGGGVAVLELKPQQPYQRWYRRLFDYVDELAVIARRWPPLKDQLRVAHTLRKATTHSALPSGAVVLLDDLHLALRVLLWEWRFGEPWGRGGGGRGAAHGPPGRGFRARDVVVHARDVELWSATFAAGGFRPHRVRPFGGQVDVRAPRTFVEVAEEVEEEEAAEAGVGAARRGLSCPPAVRRRD